MNSTPSPSRRRAQPSEKDALLSEQKGAKNSDFEDTSFPINGSYSDSDIEPTETICTDLSSRSPSVGMNKVAVLMLAGTTSTICYCTMISSMKYSFQHSGFHYPLCFSACNFGFIFT